MASIGETLDAAWIERKIAERNDALDQNATGPRPTEPVTSWLAVGIAHQGRTGGNDLVEVVQ